MRVLIRVNGYLEGPHIPSGLFNDVLKMHLI